MAATAQAAGAFAAVPTVAGASVSAKATALAVEALRGMALGWLKLAGALVLALGILAAGTAGVYQVCTLPDPALPQEEEPAQTATAAEPAPQPPAADPLPRRDVVPTAATPHVEPRVPRPGQPVAAVRLGPEEVPAPDARRDVQRREAKSKAGIRGRPASAKPLPRKVVDPATPPSGNPRGVPVLMDRPTAGLPAKSGLEP
jgi:hypothetical protein